MSVKAKKANKVTRIWLYSLETYLVEIESRTTYRDSLSTTTTKSTYYILYSSQFSCDEIKDYIENNRLDLSIAIGCKGISSHCKDIIDNKTAIWINPDMYNQHKNKPECLCGYDSWYGKDNKIHADYCPLYKEENDPRLWWKYSGK